MTIDEPHDHCRHLFDENHAHDVSDKWSKGHESAPSLAIFKYHASVNSMNESNIPEYCLTAESFDLTESNQ